MQVAPQGAAPSGQQQGGGAAEQAIQMIQQGFMQLGKMIQAAGQNLPPEDVKLFQQAASAVDALIQSLSGPSGQGQPQPRGPSGPMPPNANAGAKPAM